MNILYFFLFLILSLSGCSKSSAVKIQPNGNNPPAVDAPAISGQYCTMVSYFLYADEVGDGSKTASLYCTQPDNTWVVQAGLDGAYTDSYYKNANGDLVLVYGHGEHKISRITYSTHLGWSTPQALTENLYAYSQFGPTVVDYQNKSHVFWTTYEVPTLSIYNESNGGFVNTFFPIDPAEQGVFRHPEAWVAPDNNVLYLRYGQPKPTVWKYENGALSSLGGPPTNPSVDYTLYTALTRWNGKMILAYTRSTANLDNWAANTDETYVWAYDGTSWTQMGGAIQDTPEHDGANSYLFTQNGDLFIMYLDFTTYMPTEYNRIYGHFRVKKWDGTTWVRVGAESELMMMAQRFEFNEFDGKVFFSSLVYNSTTSKFEQIVTTWDGTTFQRLGGPIRSWDHNPPFARPGRVIKW